MKYQHVFQELKSQAQIDDEVRAALRQRRLDTLTGYVLGATIALTAVGAVVVGMHLHG